VTSSVILPLNATSTSILSFLNNSRQLVTICSLKHP
jgi:hypothetical protein